MKKLFLTAILLVSVNSIFAQNQPNIEDKITPFTIEGKQKSRKTTTLNSTTNKSITISKKAGEPQRIHDAAYYQEEINKIDAQIQAINTKISVVQNDSAENKIAVQNGWYNQMAETKERLMERKKLYQEKLKELN